MGYRPLLHGSFHIGISRQRDTVNLRAHRSAAVSFSQIDQGWKGYYWWEGHYWTKLKQMLKS